MEVICNSIGSDPECKHCGASKIHNDISCEQCPLVPNAKCISVDIKVEIEGMDYKSMLHMWRFSKCGEQPLMMGAIGDYFAKVMSIKESQLAPGEKAQISKEIGW